MKLLFDQNLSPRLVEALTHLFPDSSHVRDVGLTRADDLTVWEFAAEHGCAIVSKDSDFRQFSFLQWEMGDGGRWGTLLLSLTYASVFRRIFEIAAVETPRWRAA